MDGQARRLASLTALVAVAWLAPGAPAQATSIVYAKDGNVWLMSADGSGQYQVTLDGSPSNPYESPSQADDGTIVARHEDELHRMRQNGVPLNAPIDTPAPASGPLEPAVSPDGTRIAYFVMIPFGEPRVLYTYSDRFTGPNEINDAGGSAFPSWIDNSQTFLTAQALVWRDPVGPQDEYQWWFDGEGASSPDPNDIRNLHDGEVAANKVVLVRGDSQELLTFYHLNGDGPPIWRCAGTTTNGRFADPTLSPDGLMVAWEESDGIWTMPLATDFGDGAGCPDGSEARLVVPGGKRPDFGPADVTPEPRPQPQPQPGGAPGPGAPADLAAPSISRLRLARRSFPAAARGASMARRRPGSAIGYSLSEPARTQFTVERRLTGRRVGRRCRPRTRRNAGRPRCTFYRRLPGGFARNDPAGPTRFRFTGRLRNRKLRPGRYRLVLVATDAAGNGSAPKRVSFRITRR